MNLVQLVFKFSEERSQLMELFEKYEINITIWNVVKSPWRDTFKLVLQSFDNQDYDQLLQNEKDSLILAIQLLSKVSTYTSRFGYLKDFNRVELEQVFESCGIGEAYYKNIFDLAF